MEMRQVSAALMLVKYFRGSLEQYCLQLLIVEDQLKPGLV